jgi:hypothetical protein
VRPHLKQFGLSKTRVYRTWRNMHQRCENPKTSGYNSYGGKGIKVCADWREFLPFYDWAMANGYRDNLTIDRLDSNKNYEPGNCRWATWAEQARARVGPSGLIRNKGKVTLSMPWPVIEFVHRKAAARCEGNASQYVRKVLQREMKKEQAA